MNETFSHGFLTHRVEVHGMFIRCQHGGGGAIIAESTLEAVVKTRSILSGQRKKVQESTQDLKTTACLSLSPNAANGP